MRGMDVWRERVRREVKEGEVQKRVKRRKEGRKACRTTRFDVIGGPKEGRWSVCVHHYLRASIAANNRLTGSSKDAARDGIHHS